MFKKRLKSHHDVKYIITSKAKRKPMLPFKFWNLLNQDPKDTDGGIYVHTPYCDKICSFCNMNRKQIDNDLEDYTNYLIKEMEKFGKKNYIKKKNFSVVFFGGGTPTIFKAHQLEKILKALRNSFTLAEKYEFTFETTLHNLSWEKLELMQKYGVNRLSIGIQTFSNRGRNLLNRTYDQEYIKNRIREIKEKFNGLVCIDIIYNYLDQSLEEVKEDARILAELDVDSSSFYSLMIHDGSEISKDLKSGTKTFDYLIERDRELHHAFLNSTLPQGYDILEHTKISSGRDTYQYIRNVHQLKDLLPIGVGAGGRIGDIELYNLNKVVTFYAKDSELSKRMKLLSGVTQYKRVELSSLMEICGKSYSAVFEALKELEKNGYIKLADTHYEYTQDGTFWGNNISGLLVETLFNTENGRK